MRKVCFLHFSFSFSLEEVLVGRRSEVDWKALLPTVSIQLNLWTVSIERMVGDGDISEDASKSKSQ